MNETVKDRLLSFLNYLEIGQNKFEKNVGLSIGYLNKLRHEPSPSKLRMIINKYPQLNSDWLLTGEGEMLQSGNVINNGDNSIAAINSRVSTNRSDVRVLEEKINSLNQRINSLKQQLVEKDKRLEEKDKLIEEKERLIQLYKKMFDNQ